MEDNAAMETEQIVLPQAITGEMADDLFGELKAKIGSSISIDASQVERIDTQCVEVLVAASKQWDKDDCELNFSSVSDEFVTALQSLGLQTSMIETGGF